MTSSIVLFVTLLLISCSNGSITIPITRPKALSPRSKMETQSALPVAAQNRPQLGTEYFYATVHLGTPPTEHTVIVDSGSSLMYLTCKNTCVDCGTHTDPKYDRTLSESFESVKCSHEYCKADQGVNGVTCSSNTCQYKINYMEGSRSQGDLVSDKLQIGANGSRVVFGCSRTEAGQIKTQHADGVMGVGRGPVSITSQLAKENKWPHAYAMCLSGNHEGSLIFNERFWNIRWTKMLKPYNAGTSKFYYRVAVKYFKVGDLKLHWNEGYFANTKYHGAVLDSGCTDILLPKDVFDSVLGELKLQVTGASHYSKGDDNCWDLAHGKSYDEFVTSFPNITFGFPEILLPVELKIVPSNILFEVEANKYCMKIYDSKNNGLIIGSNAIINTAVVFDDDKDIIGFKAVDCSNYANHTWPAPVNWPLIPGSTLAYTRDLARTGFLWLLDYNNWRGAVKWMALFFTADFVLCIIVSVLILRMKYRRPPAVADMEMEDIFEEDDDGDLLGDFNDDSLMDVKDGDYDEALRVMSENEMSPTESISEADTFKAIEEAKARADAYNAAQNGDDDGF